MAGFDKKQQILKVLSDGKFHSGETLGQMLGISRAAVGKHINQLTALGVEIFRVSGKGYSLASELVLLDSEQIMEHNHHWAQKSPTVEVKHVIDSTNEYLLGKIRTGEVLANGHSVVAECQTAGRGRRGRTWFSPFGSHIYFSMYWQLQGIQQAMGLSIAVGIAVREAIQANLRADVKLKWPNDLLLDDRKVAGILVELDGQADGPCGVVIGIGINVNMPSLLGDEIGQPWTDMGSHLSGPVDRNQLVTRLMYQLYQQLTDFELRGIAPSIEQWNRHDRYFNKPIELIVGERRIKGIGRGIDEQGGILLLEQGSSQAKAFYGGEISLRGGE